MMHAKSLAFRCEVPTQWSAAHSRFQKPLDQLFYSFEGDGSQLLSIVSDTTCDSTGGSFFVAQNRQQRARRYAEILGHFSS